ncbi:MAG TPA: NosD domain-containing protein, partial [Actinomycetota bacterium]|nr:NosD domain-containing protein [Actinomycetota bacterium]
QTAASGETLEISDSRFSGNTTGVALSDSPDPTVIFRHNYVDGNTTGVLVNNSLSSFRLNTITDNETGIDFRAAGVFNDNNIFDNSDNNATACETLGPEDPEIDADNNWWGLTDEGEIEDTICDLEDEDGVRKIKFEPFEMAPVPGAATSGPPASPSPSVTTSPTGSTSPSPTSSPSPTQPPPPAEHARSVSLRLARHLKARGKVTVNDGFQGCMPASVNVRYRRRAGQPWKSVARPVVNSSTGNYSARVQDKPGVYQTKVAQSQSSSDICRPASSPKKRHGRHRR